MVMSPPLDFVLAPVLVEQELAGLDEYSVHFPFDDGVHNEPPSACMIMIPFSSIFFISPEEKLRSVMTPVKRSRLQTLTMAC